MDSSGSLRREGASPTGWRAVQRMQQASMHRRKLLTLLRKAVLRGLCAAQLVSVSARCGQKRQRNFRRGSTSSATFVKSTARECQPEPQLACGALHCRRFLVPCQQAAASSHLANAMPTQLSSVRRSYSTARLSVPRLCEFRQTQPVSCPTLDP